MLREFKTITLLTILLFFGTSHSLSDELTIINEVKLKKLLDSKNRHEASGVSFLNNTFYVVFDNHRQAARINTKLTKAKLLGKAKKKDGFEGMSYNPVNNTFYVVEESLDHKGDWNARLRVMDTDFVQTSKKQWLDYAFESDNKGFEGLASVHRNATTYILALCEGNHCKARGKGKKVGGGSIQVFEKKRKKWKLIQTINLPQTLQFIDYSGLDIRADNTLAVTSQKSSALWIGKLDVENWQVIDNGKVYTFPKSKKGKTTYCNVEGVAWISEKQLVVVSDAKKSSQPKACKKKEQSIHVVELPTAF